MIAVSRTGLQLVGELFLLLQILLWFLLFAEHLQFQKYIFVVQKSVLNASQLIYLLSNYSIKKNN